MITLKVKLFLSSNNYFCGIIGGMARKTPKTRVSGKVQATILFDEDVFQSLDRYAQSIREDRNDVIRRAVFQHLTVAGVTITPAKKTRRSSKTKSNTKAE